MNWDKLAARSELVWSFLLSVVSGTYLVQQRVRLSTTATRDRTRDHSGFLKLLEPTTPGWQSCCLLQVNLSTDDGNWIGVENCSSSLVAWLARWSFAPSSARSSSRPSFRLHVNSLSSYSTTAFICCSYSTYCPTTQSSYSKCARGFYFHNTARSCTRLPGGTLSQ
jgi:hypothetical protein